MADTTWLQAVVPKPEWEALNQRRQALKLKWGDILLPAAKEYLDKLEANPPVVVQVEMAQKPSSKPQEVKGNKRQRRAALESGLNVPPTAEEVAELEQINRPQ